MGGERGRLHSGAGFLYLVRENDERRKGEGKWWKRINLALELSWLNCPILAGWIFFLFKRRGDRWMCMPAPNVPTYKVEHRESTVRWHSLFQLFSSACS